MATTTVNMINDIEIVKSLAQAKGDIFVATSAGVIIRVPVCSTDGWVLKADSTTESGVAWASPE